MQKFHHWPEFNDSSVFKCLDNGHCDCTALQFKTSTIHHWTMFATKTTWIRESMLMPVGALCCCKVMMSDGQERMGTYYSQCSMWQLAFSHWYSMFVSYRQRRHLRTAVGKQSSVLPADCVMATCMSYVPPRSPW